MEYAMKKKEEQAPVWERINLTIYEANEYSSIGRNKLWELTNREDCAFVTWIGSKRYINRERFESYVENSRSI